LRVKHEFRGLIVKIEFSISCLSGHEAFSEADDFYWRIMDRFISKRSRIVLRGFDKISRHSRGRNLPQNGFYVAELINKPKVASSWLL